MSFLFKKSGSRPTSPKDERDRFVDPQPMQQQRTPPHVQLPDNSASCGPAPMSTSPVAASPINIQSQPMNTNHFSPPAVRTPSPHHSQQQQLASYPQSPIHNLPQFPQLSGSSSAGPPRPDSAGASSGPAISVSTSITRTTSSSALSPSGSSSSSFPPFPAPSSPPSVSRESSSDAAAFAILEEKPSEDAIILRNHFASLASISRSLFTIGDTLGTGTFGRVRLVSYLHPPLSPKTLHFALKMLKKSEIIRLKQVEHIKAEKSILARISHPFIVNLFSHFQDERYLYMLMEYVIGGELFSQLRKVGRFSNDTARFYAAEIVLALQYLHSKDIVYRDLKPENLLIDREGHIKITDFGFAKVVVDRTWTLCGTPEYLAPEIIQSKGHGKAVDWWALGILIYEMIAGYPPFYDENPFGIYQKILAGRIEFPKHFDPYAKDLVKKLLTADRSKRFGCLKDGADDVKRHRWFKGVDWVRVHGRRVKPPYVPGFASSDDTSNFDKYPDSEGEEGGGVVLTAKDKEQFVDF